MKASTALKRKREWSARSDKCPICKANFRNGCNHSVVSAHDKLEEDYIKAVMIESMKQ